jgi:Protein of unknown function (DUF982)
MLETGAACFGTITNTEEASNVPLNQRPVSAGEFHLNARRVCIAVLARKRALGDAKAALINAVREAAILVKL